MLTVTLNKVEYQELKKKAAMFERIVELAEEDKLFSLPPIRSRKQIIDGFKKIKKYNPAFLRSLNQGFKRSNYFRE